jgi:uncharacterized membrane protein YdjX (TVP38/TMEM64 family)
MSKKNVYRMMKKMKRYLPLLILVILMLATYLSGAYQYLTYENLKSHHRLLQIYVLAHPIAAPLIFMGIYFLATALSIPGALFLTLAGGFLFAFPLSTLYVVIPATLGATVVFLSARTAIGDLLKKRAGPLLAKMEKGFKKNAVNYLLFLRLVPLFPFWLVNLAPAFFGISLITFMWTTCVGILPGSIVFTQIGSGLEAIFETPGPFSLHSLFNMKIKIALICLGLFCLIPIFLKRKYKK